MPAGICQGDSPDHCCYVAGAVCRYLVENTAGRRWACGLRLELGNWDAVHADVRYLADVKPAWEASNVEDCGDYPVKNPCGTCGNGGSR